MNKVFGVIRRLPRNVLITLIRGYQQVLSPLFPPTCKFYPSCSHYAITALSTYGFMRGGWLALKRVVRCNPFSNGGFDPVPVPSDKGE